MRIGELGRLVGVSTRTLRHYESLGLLPAVRASNGYREYDQLDVDTVREIRTLVELGFTLEETRPFLACLRAGNEISGSCPDSLALHRRKLDEIDGYLTRLTAIRANLAAALDVALAARASTDPQCAFSAPPPRSSVDRLSSRKQKGTSR